MSPRVVLSCLLATALLGGGVVVAEEAGTTDQVGRQALLGVRVEVAEGTVPGLRVVGVVPGSTAVTLGLQEGDLLTSVNGVALRSRDDLATQLAALQVGQEVRIGLRRGEAAQELSGTMQARPEPGLVHEGIKATQAENDEKRRLLFQGQQAQMQLAVALQRLSDTLEKLPLELDTVAREFKEIYPDGEFTVKVLVDIRTSKDDPGTQVDLSPQDDPDPGEETDGDVVAPPVPAAPPAPTPVP